MIHQEPFVNDLAATTPSTELSPWHWAWAAILGLVTIITMAFRYALPIRDGDIWFHMMYGKYFLEHKTLIVDHTIFSWTPASNDYIYCSWLPDIFLYLLYHTTGLPGIFAFRYLCLLVLLLACFLYARKLKIVSHPLVWLMALLAVIMSYTAVFEKPEILSFVFMVCLAWNWWHIRSSGDEAWKNCYLFPGIMLFWVNSHGGFVFGAIFLVLIGLGELFNIWFSPQNILALRVRKHLLIALLLASLMPLLTPYGYHYPLQMVDDFLPKPGNIYYNNQIAAYSAPFDFLDNYNFALCADLAIIILLLLYARNFKKSEWSSLFANMFFAFLYTRFFRTTFYWVPILLFSSLHLISMRPLIPLGRQYGRALSRIFPLLVLTVGVGLAGNSLYYSATLPESYLWMGFGISDQNPVAETAYIKKYFPQSRIGNTYDQGAYLLWELWPDNKVFFDARHFPYRELSDEFFSFSAGRNIRQMTKKYPCDLWCVGLKNSTLIIGLLSTKEWKLAYYGKNAAVLVRSDIPLPPVSPVSDDLYELHSLQSAIDLVKFTTLIGDYEVAEKLVAVMPLTFTQKLQQHDIQWITKYMYGMKAYQQKKYATAAKLLGLLENPPAHVQFIHTNCYQFLTKMAWEKDDLSAALKFAKKSLDLVPDNPYSLLNVGIIGWRQQREKNSTPAAPEGSVVTDENGWRDPLEQFLRHATDDPVFKEYQAVVKSILAGKQTELPHLLFPPEPTGQFFLPGDMTTLKFGPAQKCHQWGLC